VDVATVVVIVVVDELSISPDWYGIKELEAGAGISVAVTGQTVVVSDITSVVTEPIRAGQSVTVAAQEVIVYTVVV
jgi:hypothetical protein